MTRKKNLLWKSDKEIGKLSYKDMECPSTVWKPYYTGDRTKWNRTKRGLPEYVNYELHVITLYYIISILFVF